MHNSVNSRVLTAARLYNEQLLCMAWNTCHLLKNMATLTVQASTLLDGVLEKCNKFYKEKRDSLAIANIVEYGNSIAGMSFTTDDKWAVFTKEVCLNLVRLLVHLRDSSGDNPRYYAARVVNDILFWHTDAFDTQRNSCPQIHADFNSMFFDLTWPDEVPSSISVPTKRTTEIKGMIKYLTETKGFDVPDFAMYPVLADALEEAGCTNETVLTHMRAKKHHLGCWLIEWLKF